MDLVSLRPAFMLQNDSEQRFQSRPLPLTVVMMASASLRSSLSPLVKLQGR